MDCPLLIQLTRWLCTAATQLFADTALKDNSVFEAFRRLNLIGTDGRQSKTGSEK